MWENPTLSGNFLAFFGNFSPFPVKYSSTSRFSKYKPILDTMEKLDSVFLNDIRNHMYFCTGLAVRFVSLVSDLGDVDNPECREVLKRMMCTMIMECDVQRVLSFLSVPVRFVMGEEADKVLEDAREVLEGMEISTEDRLLGALFG